MSLHTLGPWTVAADSFGIRRIWGPEEESIACTDGDGGIGHEERKANESLIAAAPDLLAALEGLEPIIQTARSNASGNPDWYWVKERTDAARAAIKKAKGA